MKSKLVQCRLTEAEYGSLQQKCTQSGMSQSEFIRASISNVEVKMIGKDREIMKEICAIYSILNQMATTQEATKLIERVDQICRFLK